MPDRYTDDELRAIVGCSWALPEWGDSTVRVPPIEVQRAVHDKARAELAARGEAVSALNALVYLKDGPRDRRYRESKDGAWARARSALAALGYALPDPDGGATREEEERGPQGRQDQAERAQGNREGEGEAGGPTLSETYCDVTLLHGEACCGLPGDCEGPTR